MYALLRGGFDFLTCDDLDGLPVSQLGLRLKALALAEKRLDRLGKTSG